MQESRVCHLVCVQTVKPDAKGLSKGKMNIKRGTVVNLPDE
jgi:hypothetical protein